jgi:NAD(P)-dependent dehydrogenase (short-subunit alcohol dehydrogenase family)
MKTVVITGSTRGIGYGLADSFLDLGCAVVVSGRATASVERAVAELSAKHEPDHIFGHPCDATRLEQVQGLWDAALARFGQIDIWINNAGMGNPQLDFWDCSQQQIQAVVDTNLIGTMYGTKVALRGMLDQGYGSLYNMEGLGSDGRRVEGLTLYGTTKYALRYFTDALVEETRETSLLVGALSPGMVITDLITGQYEDRPEDWEGAKRIFNILADRVEDVAPWIAQRVLDNDKTGVRIKWLTRGKIMGRFIAALFRKRDLFDDQGKRT